MPLNLPLTCNLCFQCYIVFVLADGGTDLESFALVDYKEAHSLLVQVRTMNFIIYYIIHV